MGRFTQRNIWSEIGVRAYGKKGTMTSGAVFCVLMGPEHDHELRVRCIPTQDDPSVERKERLLRMVLVMSYPSFVSTYQLGCQSAAA